MGRAAVSSDPDEVVVDPYLRRAIFNAFLGLPFNYLRWEANAAAMDKITNDYLAGPGGADARRGRRLHWTRRIPRSWTGSGRVREEGTQNRGGIGYDVWCFGLGGKGSGSWLKDMAVTAYLFPVLTRHTPPQTATVPPRQNLQNRKKVKLYTLHPTTPNDPISQRS